MVIRSIPNEIGRKFGSPDGRKEMMQGYTGIHSGTNSDGETVLVSISPTLMTLTTFQGNGWVRVNWYDANGLPAGETFDGKWC